MLKTPSRYIRGNSHVKARKIVTQKGDEEELLSSSLDGASENSSSSDETVVQTQRRVLRKIFIRARKLGSKIMIGACLFLAFVLLSFAIGPSNFILWGVLDLSLVLRRFSFYCRQVYWHGPDVETHAIRYDCTFDLCKHMHKGGEGHLFRGSCENINTSHRNNKDAPSIPVLIKTLVGNHVFEGAGQEADATMWMGRKSKVHVLHKGINFIIFRQLEGYQSAVAVYRQLKTDEMRMAFVQQFLRQSLDQLHWLHKKHLHLDLHHFNILSKWDGRSSWDFQLIDFSDSRPIRQSDVAVREAFKTKEHLPKHPLTMCLLKRIPRYARDYCRAHTTLQICPGLLDSFMVAVLALDFLHREAKIELRMPSGFGFKEIVAKLDYLKDILKRTEEKNALASAFAETTDMIAQILDENRFNSTLACGASLPCKHRGQWPGSIKEGSDSPVPTVARTWAVDRRGLFTRPISSAFTTRAEPMWYTPLTLNTSCGPRHTAAKQPLEKQRRVTIDRTI
eukprot:scaffold287_cov173-Amphora_coffeaeformis.AAC.16